MNEERTGMGFYTPSSSSVERRPTGSDPIRQLFHYGFYLVPSQLITDNDVVVDKK